VTGWKWMLAFLVIVFSDLSAQRKMACQSCLVYI
jgi:hypothetical protein